MNVEMLPLGQPATPDYRAFSAYFSYVLSCEPSAMRTGCGRGRPLSGPRTSPSAAATERSFVPATARLKSA
jgi:hypothetical protein